MLPRSLSLGLTHNFTMEKGMRRVTIYSVQMCQPYSRQGLKIFQTLKVQAQAAVCSAAT